RQGIRRFLRRHRGSQVELASMLGVSESFLSLWLNGRGVSARLEKEVPDVVKALQQRILERGEIRPKRAAQQTVVAV
ncbi:MAG: hypothetical protein ACRD4B_05490, partial [Acidobacteriota bacterium]